MEAAFALSGQVAGRISSLVSVADILADTSRQCREILTGLSKDI